MRAAGPIEAGCSRYVPSVCIDGDAHGAHGVRDLRMTAYRHID